MENIEYRLAFLQLLFQGLENQDRGVLRGPELAILGNAFNVRIKRTILLECSTEQRRSWKEKFKKQFEISLLRVMRSRPGFGIILMIRSV